MRLPGGGETARKSRRWRTARSRRWRWRKPAPRAEPGLQGRCRGTTARWPDWRGRTVLVNLWATWCVPCRREMPALDKLQAARRPEIPGGRDQYRQPQPGKAAGVPQGGRHHPPRLLFRRQRQGVSGPQSRRQSLRHADHADRRSLGLRDRQHGRPRRMVQRRRREARPGGDRKDNPTSGTTLPQPTTSKIGPDPGAYSTGGMVGVPGILVGEMRGIAARDRSSTSGAAQAWLP